MGISKTITRKGEIILHITSENRTSGTESDFITPITPGIIKPTDDNEVLVMSIADITIPYTWYNTSAAFGNNTFNYNAGLTTIPDGNYTALNFATTINGLTAAGSLTYNTITGKYDFVLGANTLEPLNGSGKLFGLNDDQVYTGSFSSDRPINLLYGERIFVHLEVNSNDRHVENLNYVGFELSNIISSIPITTPPYSLITLQNEADDHHSVVVKDVPAQIRLFLTIDDNTTRLPLTHHWHCGIRLLYKNKYEVENIMADSLDKLAGIQTEKFMRQFKQKPLITNPTINQVQFS